MKVGDRVVVIPYIGEKYRKLTRGTVIYINKEHHYYTVRLDDGYCQSFKTGTNE